MKLLIVIQTILISLIITVMSIFTIDGVTVRKAEIASIMAIEAENIVDDFFKGEISDADLQGALKTAFEESFNSKFSEVKITVFYANAEQGIVNFLLDLTYIQPTGRPRLLSYERVFIQERPSGDTGSEYRFIRTIGKSVYKTSSGALVAENQGGLKTDSIWRTTEYTAALDTVFGISE